ncbi:hypothetical protein HDZ31DRAFT_76975 [Schizophyllum fasciatum]
MAARTTHAREPFFIFMCPERRAEAAARESGAPLTHRGGRVALPRPISASRAIGAATRRPRDWHGDVVGKHCNVEKSWRRGAELATTLLTNHGININFDALFLPDNHDLMRPQGGNYPGVSQDSPDQSQSSDKDDTIKVSAEEDQELGSSERPRSKPKTTSDVQAIKTAITHAQEQLQARAVATHSVWMKLNEAG